MNFTHFRTSKFIFDKTMLLNFSKISFQKVSKKIFVPKIKIRIMEKLTLQCPGLESRRIHEINNVYTVSQEGFRRSKPHRNMTTFVRTLYFSLGAALSSWLSLFKISLATSKKPKLSNDSIAAVRQIAKQI